MFELDRFVVHREWEVEGLVYGLLSGYPTFWIGPVGIAKTYAIDRLVASIRGARLFRYLLTKFTEPEELFGPYNIKELRKGRLVRSTKNKLPEANIVYLDEPFKASSAIRNALLDLMLYGRFFDGEKYVKTDIKAMYMSANEVPIFVEDIAFFDRAAVRLFSTRLDEQELVDVLTTPYVPIEDVRKVVSIDDIEEGQREVQEVERNLMSERRLMSLLVNIVKRVKEESQRDQSQEPLDVSERRLVMIRRIAAVAAYIYGEEPNDDHIAIALSYGLPASPYTASVTRAVIERDMPNTSISYIDRINTIKAELKNVRTDEDRQKIQAKLDEIRKTMPKRHFLTIQLPH